MGPSPDLLRAVAERADRHRLQLRRDRCRSESFEELLTRSDLKGKITLLSEMRDTMGFMLKVTGADPSKFTEDEWANAIDRLAVVVNAGQIRSFTGNEYIQDLAAGNIVACEAWSGDVIQAQFDNPAIKFVTPEEGLSIWSDNMLVPNLADPPGQRRGVDQLLLRARGGREARRVGELHLPRQGRPARRWRRSIRPWSTTS